MTKVSSSAPGKVFVAGEYAVLQGAPAICVAVNRRANVSMAASEDGNHSVSAPGYRPAEIQFENVADIATEQPLLAAVWERLPVAKQTSLKIEIDTGSFFSGDQKLGIGSSAAVAVALAGALAAFSEQGGDVHAQAHAAHLAFQGGRGSGADVASSYHGGVIAYRMHEAAAAINWPEHLHYAILWSGRSCSTSAQLKKLVGIRSSAANDALVTTAEQVAALWCDADGESILHALREFASALRLYDDEYDLGIYSAGHAAVAELAGPTGVVYKPSGAGGGDYGMAVADDPQALHQFVADAEDQGFVHADLKIDPDGLVVEQVAQ